MIDRELVRHCLSDFGSVNSPSCKVIVERTHLMKDNLCEGGLSIRDTVFGYLVEAVRERNELEPKMEREPRPKRKVEVDYASATAQVAALSYTVALMDSPININPEKVLADAEREASREDHWS